MRRYLREMERYTCTCTMYSTCTCIGTCTCTLSVCISERVGRRTRGRRECTSCTCTCTYVHNMYMWHLPLMMAGKQKQELAYITRYRICNSRTCIYVGHKAWICAIRGLPSAKHGSVLCASHPRIDPRLCNPRITHA